MIVLVGVIGVMADRYLSNLVRDNAANELRVLSVVMSKQLGLYFQKAETQLSLLSQTHSFLDNALKTAPKQGSDELPDDYLSRKIKQLSMFEVLLVVDKNGNIQHTSNPQWQSSDFQSWPLAALAVNQWGQQVRYQDVFIDQAGKTTLLMATPIGGGSSNNTLIARLNLTALDELLDQPTIIPNVVDAFLLDGRLRFITPQEDALEGSHLLKTPLVMHLGDDSFWVGEYDAYNGEAVLGTVMSIDLLETAITGRTASAKNGSKSSSLIRPAKAASGEPRSLENRHWYLVLERDYKSIAKQIGRMRFMVLTASLVALLLAIPLINLIAHSTTRPTEQLMTSARQIAAGDLSRPVSSPKGAAEEIAFLATEFEKMRVAILTYQTQLLEKLQVSERKSIENERLAAIGALASNLAHEIRNPLNALSLLVQRLEWQAHQAGQPQKPYADIRSEIGRLDRLVSSILDYAKPLTLRLSDVDLTHLVKEISSLFQPVMEEKNIYYTPKTSNETLVIQGDQDMIKQMIINVLQNAIEATPAGNNISLDLKKEPLQQRAIIEIHDTGVGIQESDKSKLFQLFFTTKSQGTGLGLSMVQKIINAHGGEIEIESKPKEGTCVRLSLPFSNK